MPLNITIDHNPTAHSPDRSSSSVSDEEEDSSGTGVQVSPSSAVGSHDYSETLEEPDGWLLYQQREIGPSESASRPPTSHQHRHPPPAPEPEPPRHPVRRASTHNRPHRQPHPRAHRPPPPIPSESVDPNEEWAGYAPAGYARGPTQHHARTYAHWGNVVAPAPQNYTANYSSGQPYGQFPPPNAIPAGQQLVPFAGPSPSYGYSPFQAATGGVPPGYYPTQQPGGVHMGSQTHGAPPYGGPDVMHHAPGGGYFAYGAQPYPVPQAHVFHPYPAVYSPPPAQTPPPAPVVDSSKDDEKFARLEKILMDQKAEQEAKEAAALKAAEDKAAKAASDQKIAADISAAASAAAAAATEEAEKKAAEEAAKKVAEEAAKNAAEEAEKKKAEADAAVVSAAVAAAAAAAAPPPPPEEKKKPIRFKDAVGRKYSFPFHLCNTWPAMEDLIRQAFLHVEIIGPHVADGHYDLVGSNGEIILPQVWDTVIEPDAMITMHMWPLPEPPPKEEEKEKPADPPAVDVVVVVPEGKKPKGGKAAKPPKAIIPVPPPVPAAPGGVAVAADGKKKAPPKPLPFFTWTAGKTVKPKASGKGAKKT